MSAPTTDMAVRHPDDDLLGIAPYARTLAEFVRGVQPPFTIGIYGEWGAGKSTFVNFLEHYLTHEPGANAAPGAPGVLFVPFTAWPFKSADELWRALVLTIARRLYDVPEDAPAASGAPTISATAAHAAAPRPPSSGWKAFLGRDALLLRPEEKPADPLAPYRELVEQLDESMVSGIGRSTDSAARIDPEQSAVAVLRAAMAGLSALSPLAGIARSFLKVDDHIDGASLLQRSKNKATRERIQSMSQFRSIVRQLFVDQAKGRKVVVFVDDLDRCMPDVALDLLEATKIFMGEVPCIFVVAADEQLIGQGLRMRYKEMLAGGASDEATSLLTRKGQEYFEKIIQLRINVPSRTSTQTQTFLTALYPQWMGATDIIEIAIGDNPRRLRQYCAWLGYKRLVEQSFSPPDDARRATMLDRLVQIKTRNGACHDELIALSIDAARWKPTLEAMEAFFARPDAERDYDTTKAFIDGCGAPSLAMDFSQSAPLRRLLLDEPRMSTYDPTEARVLARVAQSRPSGVTILTAWSDGVFGRMLQSFARTGLITPRRILEEDVWRLEVLRALHPTIIEPLRVLASDAARWPQAMRAVLAHLDTPGDAPGSPAEEALLAAIRPLLVVPTSPPTGLRALLEEMPPLVDLSPLVVAAVCAPGRPHFMGPTAMNALLSASSSAASVDAQTRTAIVDGSLAIMPPDVRAAIDAELALQEWAARHCFALRASAKLNALERRWPKLAALLNENRASFTSIESQVGAAEPLPEELQRIWEEHRDDEVLREFLTLRPLVRDIETVQLRQFFKASGVADGDASTRRAAAPAPVVASAPPAAPTPVSTPAAAPPVDALEANDVEIAFDVSPSAPPRAGLNTYALAVRTARDRFDGESKIDLDALQAMWIANGLGKASTESLISFGRALFEQAFPDAAAFRTLQAYAPRRLFVNALPWTLDTIPWEALVVPTESLYPALSQSMVRFVAGAPASPPRRLTWPLRVLCVLLRPETYAQPLLSEEGSAMDRAFEAAITDKRARLERLHGEGASEAGLRQMLGSVRPQILHLRVACGATPDEGYALLANGPSSMAATSRDLSRAIAQSTVEVVVLHGVDTSDPVWNRASVRFARTLAEDGVPATIVNTHGDVGEARLMFIREFYRAFSDGLSVETALSKARYAMAGERLDFSSYALFTGRRELDSIALRRE